VTAEPRLLLVDDSPDDRALAIRTLRQAFPHLQVMEITSLAAFDRAMEAPSFDLVVTDYRLRWSDGLTILRRVKERYPQRPVVLYTNSGNEEIAVEALKVGGDDYVIKAPRKTRRLATAVRLALERADLQVREQEALRLRDLFLSVAAHELRTPLTIALGHIDLLKLHVASGQLALDERDRRSFDVIVRQAASVRRLLNDLLDISRIGEGVLEIAREPVDVGALARRVVEDARPLLRGHTLHLRYTGEPLCVEGDALRLEQALQNLVQNAVTYSPGGGPVTVTVAREGVQACLAVADRGIGIPAAEHARLFERFYRASNVNPLQTGGFGVGLFVAHAIVTRHGGAITVQSVEGQGSTFTVSLPLTLHEVAVPPA
jgi:signal transduction histidine kinase